MKLISQTSLNIGVPVQFPKEKNVFERTIKTKNKFA